MDFCVYGVAVAERRDGRRPTQLFQSIGNFPNVEIAGNKLKTMHNFYQHKNLEVSNEMAVSGGPGFCWLFGIVVKQKV